MTSLGGSVALTKIAALCFFPVRLDLYADARHICFLQLPIQFKFLLLTGLRLSGGVRQQDSRGRFRARRKRFLVLHDSMFFGQIQKKSLFR